MHWKITHETKSDEPAPFLSVALVSGTALANEILLLRLFSIAQWHHFAYMIISLALLGYGMSGSVLTILRPRLLARFHVSFVLNIMLFGVSIIGCYLLARQVPFNPEEILWAPVQSLHLLVLYLLLSLPFFFAANTVALAFARYRPVIPRIYAADMIGAAFGSLASILLLFALFPDRAVCFLATLGLAAAGVAWLELRLYPVRAALFFLLLAALPLALPSDWTRPVMNPYKSLNQYLQIQGARIIEQRSSPLGLLTVLENRKIPLRYAPGLSLNARGDIPEQLGVFTDGDAMTALIRNAKTARQIAFLDQLTSALPYHLDRPQHALILGAGGGMDVMQARYFEVPRITAVEMNPQMLALTTAYCGFGRPRDRPASSSTEQVDFRLAEARGFVTASHDRFGLIQLALLDSITATSSGLYALNENYLYTVEAFAQYLDHLVANGFLSITRWIRLPPRDTLKLFATAIAALERKGVTDPENRLLLIRGWQTATLLVKNGTITVSEIARLKAFCQTRSFDPAYYPGMDRSEANCCNVLSGPLFFDGASALLSRDRAGFMARYKFHIAPATDDSPFFYRFFKWESLPEILALRAQGGMPLLEWGYLILAVTLIQAILVSLALIILPVLLTRRRTTAASETRHLLMIFLYFSAIGLAFLFMEIAFIQKSILFLGHPLYAAVAALTGFLIFAGLGSGYAQSLIRRSKESSGVGLIVSGIFAAAIIAFLLLGRAPALLAGLEMPVKIGLTATIIAPLAFCMGMPFPVALARLDSLYPDLMPWAWAVNGCASVVSAVLATLLAIHYGFAVVVGLALLLYVIAALTFGRL